MFHRSDRLFLRPIWPEDWPGIFFGIADQEIVRNLASAPWPYSEDYARSFAARKIEPHEPRFLITTAQNAEVIGCIGLDLNDDEQDNTIELGYWIARKHWGHGFATEAGNAVIRVAKTLGYKRIVAEHFLDNPASGKVLKKLGFSSTGKIQKRLSLGRGEKSDTAGYELELVCDVAGMKDAA